MQKIYTPFNKRSLFFVAAILFSAQLGLAQAVYVPYSYQLYQKFDNEVYSPANSIHTSLKPYLLDSSLVAKYNAVMSVGVDSSRKTWLARKFFNEHLVDLKTNEYTFYVDYLTDMEVGRDFANSTTTFVNTKAYQLGGTIGSKIYFYSSGYENQAKFPNYYYNYVEQIKFIPGQAYDRDNINTINSTTDWSYSTAIVSYTPIKQLNITLGEDKTFIGDGYRSLLLSDVAASYPLLRLTANLGKVQYMMMVADMEDILLHKYDTFGNNRRKMAAFHYLDWNVTNRLSLGFFDALIAAQANDEGVRHPFDANYINPLPFFSALGPSTPYKDNVLTGFTGKYKVLDKTIIYAQLLLDRFKASDFFSGNSTDNTNGFQLGVRGSDLFNASNLNYLFEYNTVKPYTYAAQQPISAYTNYSQSLGDPLGANFKEAIGILSYHINRFDFQGELEYATYGLDAKNTDYGKNVTLPFNPANEPSAATGQGIHTQLFYGEGTVSYILNPKSNFQIFGGAVVRRENNAVFNKKSNWITFGLKSSFRSLYHDF